MMQILKNMIQSCIKFPYLNVLQSFFSGFSGILFIGNVSLRKAIFTEITLLCTLGSRSPLPPHLCAFCFMLCPGSVQPSCSPLSHAAAELPPAHTSSNTNVEMTIFRAVSES